jgi:hypothetical protein
MIQVLYHNDFPHGKSRIRGLELNLVLGRAESIYAFHLRID